MSEQDDGLKEVWCVEWEESERGWGVRPDGWSLHLTDQDAYKYIRLYWDGMPDSTPDEYSRPVGEAYGRLAISKVLVNTETYQQLEEQREKCGVRVWKQKPVEMKKIS